MQANSHTMNLADIIFNNYNGRELVFWGNQNLCFENYLKEKYGLCISFYVFWKKELCNDKTIRHMKYVLDGGKEKYYIINLDLCPTQKNMAFLIEQNYIENIDFVLGGINESKVPKGKLNYNDNNGNKCNYCPLNCNITFKGKNSEIYIDENIVINKALNIIIHTDSKVTLNERCILGEGLLLAYNNAYIIFDKCYYKLINSIVYDNATLSIGRDTSIIEAYFSVFNNHSVIIDEDCMLSQKIVVIAGDGHAIFDVNTKKRLYYAEDKEEKSNNIIISRHVWVGMGVTILSGANIQSGSILGAGTIVKKSFPNNCSIAGNPAKIVRRDVAWCRDYLELDIDKCGLENVKLTEEL